MDILSIRRTIIWGRLVVGVFKTLVEFFLNVFLPFFFCFFCFCLFFLSFSFSSVSFYLSFLSFLAFFFFLSFSSPSPFREGLFIVSSESVGFFFLLFFAFFSCFFLVFSLFFFLFVLFIFLSFFSFFLLNICREPVVNISSIKLMGKKPQIGKLKIKKGLIRILIVFRTVNNSAQQNLNGHKILDP